MQTFSSLTICRMGLFFCEESPKIYLPLVASNLRDPSSFSFRNPFAKINSFQSMLVVVFAVCSILPVCGFSKVLKSVIRFVTIDVVNHFCRHIASYVEPGKAMGSIRLPINLNIDVSFVMQASSFRPNLHFWTRFVPIQISRIGVITKDGRECGVIKHAYILPGFALNCKKN